MGLSFSGVGVDTTGITAPTLAFPLNPGIVAGTSTVDCNGYLPADNTLARLV